MLRFIKLRNLGLLFTQRLAIVGPQRAPISAFRDFERTDLLTLLW